MSIFTAQPAGIVVFRSELSFRVVRVIRRAELYKVSVERDGDTVRILCDDAVVARVEYKRGDGEDYLQFIRRVEHVGDAIYDSIVDEDADVVWTRNEGGWTRVPDKRTK